VDDEPRTALELVQPTRRREWELRHGDERLGSLQLPAMRRGGKARVGDRELEIRANGFFKVEHLVVDAGTGDEVACVRQNTLERPGLEESARKSLGRGKGHGFVAADGEPWLRAKVSSGLFRTTRQLEVAPGHDVAVPAVLAAYLLIRTAEEVASSAAGATVVAT
jgi:hypothetical protein